MDLWVDSLSQSKASELLGLRVATKSRALLHVQYGKKDSPTAQCPNHWGFCEMAQMDGSVGVRKLLGGVWARDTTVWIQT